MSSPSLEDLLRMLEKNTTQARPVETSNETERDPRLVERDPRLIEQRLERITAQMNSAIAMIRELHEKVHWLGTRTAQQAAETPVETPAPAPVGSAEAVETHAVALAADAGDAVALPADAGLNPADAYADALPADAGLNRADAYADALPADAGLNRADAYADALPDADDPAGAAQCSLDQDVVETHIYDLVSTGDAVDPSADPGADVFAGVVAAAVDHLFAGTAGSPTKGVRLVRRRMPERGSLSIVRPEVMPDFVLDVGAEPELEVPDMTLQAPAVLADDLACPAPPAPSAEQIRAPPADVQIDID
jgi:hypothetical protein